MSKHYHSGIDTWSAEPGTVTEDQFCKACRTKMNVERSVDGATSWGEAMSKSKHLHDSWSCPNAGEDWHDQVIALRRAAKSTPSKVQELELLGEAEGLLITRVATKKVSWFL